VIASAADQQGRIGIGGVYEVLDGQKLLGSQALVDFGSAHHVLLHRQACLHVGNQVSVMCTLYPDHSNCRFML
jgi:hypothetical protein